MYKIRLMRLSKRFGVYFEFELFKKEWNVSPSFLGLCNNIVNSQWTFVCDLSLAINLTVQPLQNQASNSSTEFASANRQYYRREESSSLPESSHQT